MKAVVAAFNQEKALVGAFSVITNLRMELFEALVVMMCCCQGFNRIAAIALLFLDEEEAFWCLLYILEVLLPETYYKKQMVGAQVDQVSHKTLI